MTPDPAPRRFRLPWRDAARVAADVDAELDFHLAACAQELVAEGWAPADARREAERRFGDVERTRRYCRTQDHGGQRRARIGTTLEELAHDARHALRQLRAAPGFTAVALLTLALGIGANTAIFSVVRGVVLRPLPYAEPERVVRVFETTRAGERSAVSPTNFADWRDQARSFAGLAAITGGDATLTRAGAEPLVVEQQWATAELFAVLGTRPIVGRVFAPGDDRVGAPRIAVLGEGLWRRAFGADPGVVGRTVTIDGEPYDVVGVVPAGAGFPVQGELWTPLELDPAELPTMRGAHYLRVVGRLAPGATVESAAAEMRAIGARLAQQYPRWNEGEGADVAGARDAMVGEVRTPLLVLLAAVGLVLLVACANVANLLLARGVGRAGEMAVRAALGAGRGRLARQLLTESAVLALLGGLLGTAVAVGLTRLFVRYAPTDLPRLAEVRVDGTVLAVALLTVVVVGALAGVGPALQSGRVGLDRALREGGRGGVGRGGLRVVDGIAAAEMALAVMLLVGAGLLVRSFDRLRQVDPGFVPEQALSFTVTLPEATYESPDRQRRFAEALVARVGALPGARSAGATFLLPLAGGYYGLSVETLDDQPVTIEPQPSAQIRTATPGFFAAMGIRLVQGRGITAADRAGAPPVVVVNETAARRLFPDGRAIGRRITLGTKRDGVPFGGEIVGIVGDVRQRGLDADALPEVYASHDQWPFRDLAVVVRAAGDPAALASGVRAIVRDLDPNLPVSTLATLEEVVGASVARPRFYMLLLGGFAAAALLLAAIGVYGVISYAVGRRTREIGVRLALGATSGRVLREVVGRGLALATIGLVVGGAGALVVTRLLRSLLFGVGATDPVAFAGAALLLVAVAVGAAIVPARRAARVSPIAAMRE